MLLGKQSIKRIVCEHLDDIEVEENNSILKYYQIKSTQNKTLPTSKIIDSIKLFLSIQKTTPLDMKDQYILVSNANIEELTKECLVVYPFSKLRYDIRKKIAVLKQNENKECLKKIFFMKGPPLEEIDSIITAGLVDALKDKNHNYDFVSIKDDLLNRINRMCPAPVDLQDLYMIHEAERDSDYRRSGQS
jgi:hypothetical protein